MDNNDIREQLSETLINPEPAVLESVTQNLSGLDLALAPFVVKLIAGDFKEKPKVSELEVEMWGEDGKPKKLKPSSKQLSEAWAFVTKEQSQLDDSTSLDQPTSEAAEMVGIVFVQSYKSYVSGDKTRRKRDTAQELVDAGIAEFI